MSPKIRPSATIVAREALAYLRAGALNASQRRVDRKSTPTADLGVLFVHGVGAKPAQFAALQGALASTIGWFDAVEFAPRQPLARLAERLAIRITESNLFCPRLCVIGHSLGGLVARCVLQGEIEADPDGPKGVVGYVSICAPLYGTTRAAFAPTADLRALRPDNPLFARLRAHEARLRRYRILTIGSRIDHFVAPYSTAFLSQFPCLELEDVGHVGSLFDVRVHAAVRALIADCKNPGAADSRR